MTILFVCTICFTKNWNETRKLPKVREIGIFQRRQTTNLHSSLVQYQQIFDLLFMQDFSHLLMHTSKEFQRFDVLPFYRMNMSEQLITLLISFAELFTKDVIPDEYPFHHGEQQYVIWKPFKTVPHEIIKTGEFHGSKLLLPTLKGQITLRFLRYTIPNMFASQMVLYALYIYRLVEHCLIRFNPTTRMRFPIPIKQVLLRNS